MKVPLLLNWIYFFNLALLYKLSSLHFSDLSSFFFGPSLVVFVIYLLLKWIPFFILILLHIVHLSLPKRLPNDSQPYHPYAFATTQTVLSVPGYRRPDTSELTELLPSPGRKRKRPRDRRMVEGDLTKKQIGEDLR